MRRAIADRRIRDPRARISCVEIARQPQHAMLPLSGSQLVDDLGRPGERRRHDASPTRWLIFRTRISSGTSRMKEHELDLARSQALRPTPSPSSRLASSVAKLLAGVKVTSPVRICHQEQRVACRGWSSSHCTSFQNHCEARPVSIHRDETTVWKSISTCCASKPSICRCDLICTQVLTS